MGRAYPKDASSWNSRNAKSSPALGQSALARSIPCFSLVVLRVIDPSCLFGGGGIPPPVIPVTSALVRGACYRSACQTRTHTTARPTNCSVGRRSLSGAIGVSKTWLPRSGARIEHICRARSI